MDGIVYIVQGTKIVHNNFVEYNKQELEAGLREKVVTTARKTFAPTAYRSYYGVKQYWRQGNFTWLPCTSNIDIAAFRLSKMQGRLCPVDEDLGNVFIVPVASQLVA